MVTSDNVDHLSSVVEMVLAAVSLTRQECEAEVQMCCCLTEVIVQRYIMMNIIAVGKILRANRQQGKLRSTDYSDYFDTANVICSL